MHSRHQTLLSLLLGATALLSPGLVSAQVIFDNGAPDNASGYYVAEGGWVADDFVLGSPATLGSFQWFGSVSPTGGAPTNLASFNWRIFSEAAGARGSMVTGGAAIGLIGTRSSYYCCLTTAHNYDVYAYSIDLGNLALDAGTYWLAIGEYSTTPASGVYWETSSITGGNAMISSDGVTFSPMRYPFAQAFSISGATTTAPEPASLILLATGLAGIHAVTRRRRARRAEQV